MEENLIATSDPVVINEEIAEELDLTTTDQTNSVSSGDVIVEYVVQEDLLTNDTYLQGVDVLVNSIDNFSVNEEVLYVDRPVVYVGDPDLPDYAVVYECNGVVVVFPTDYAENIIIQDGMLINLGDAYTAGAQIDGYSVSNYLSSEITIPTYHSSTWYQYLQTYGQPYRIIDRYVNTNGYISSSTRSSVAVEWSGGNVWEGFTFDRVVPFLIICFLAIKLLFRKEV